MATNNTVRFSQFNASLNRNSEGQLLTDLSTPDNSQAQAVAEIIQRANPDVLLINEFDYLGSDPLQAVELFQQNYLSVSQNQGTPVNYPYVYIAPSNTGVDSGFDLDNNGTIGGGNDAFGFGNFPGQFGMLLLSKYPIDTANVRTFQEFLWKDMPNSLLPTISTPGSGTPWYSPAEQEVLRLSSKSHWDVPILINGETVHVLVSHPTPPVFDGDEDRNGKRNHDEIRFWSDYVTPEKGNYIYDDQGNIGGLSAGSSFVIMGDQNADPFDGDSFDNAILQLLQNPQINTNSIPSSPGGAEQAALQGNVNDNHNGNPYFDTADFADGNSGNLRTDYVLPSSDLQITNSAVFWPTENDPNFAPVGTFPFPSSDHRLVFADVEIGATEVGNTIADVGFSGQTVLETGFVPSGEAGTIGGVEVALGGLSGVTYDRLNDQYYAISDDRSSNARFYTFNLDPVTNAVNFTKVVQLRDIDGNPFAANSLDPEGIALTSNGTVFISSEGEVRPDLGETRVTNPFIKEFDLMTGQEIRSLAVPQKFLPLVEDTNNNNVVDTGDTQTAGVRNNLAFESLTITPDQKTLFTATENALFQDGDRTTLENGTPSRIIQYNLVTGQPEKEYLYITDPIAKAPIPSDGFADSGLVDLLAIDNRGTLLAVERSFAIGQGNTIQIYEVSLQGATDINTIDSLSSLSSEELAAIRPTQKRLLLNLDDLSLPNSDGNHPTGTDNIEGITFGPKLADGSQSIVLVSDNNFGATQFTQIITLNADLVPTATPLLETRPDLFDDEDPAQAIVDQNADADDPAIYVNAENSADSLVLTAVKNAGVRVYDLSGNLLQTVNPGEVRYNNIDLQYGFQLGNETIDIAVASDRGNDKLVIFKINPNSTDGNYLEDITDSNISTIFQAAPFAPPYEPSSRSAYGLGIYRSPVTNDYYVFTGRRDTGDIAQFKLVDLGNGQIGAERVRQFTVPTTNDIDPQTEGMVIDQETGYLYIGQENVGIWKYNAEPNSGDNTGVLIDRVADLGGNNLVADVEGLTIYYGADGKGYLLASSQGDNTFAAYSREGNNEFLGRFAIGNNGAIDSVQESDGADVINVPLGANFPYGLFVTQDGNNDPAKLVEDDGELENVNSNFKFVPWENIANTLPDVLEIDTTSYDPRNPVARVNPFVNGVASGDTNQTSTVLWTRSIFAGEITFEYSTDPNFSNIVGTETTNVTDTNLPVKVTVNGLTPNTNYYYRVSDINGATSNGKFSTAAVLGQQTGLKFGVSGDWRGDLAPYPAVSNADEADLKFFVQFGDTIYADYGSPVVLNPDGTEKEQATTLDEYRAKQAEVYGQRYGQNTLGDLRQSTSIFATIDDHEVTNNFDGGEDLGTANPDIQALFGANSGLQNDSPLYENGLQAFQEYNPITDQFYGETGDETTAGERKLYRFNTYGSDAATFVLDARSFRDAALPDVTDPTNATEVANFLQASFDPNRTMLGEVQLEDLKNDLLQAQSDGITWKFIMMPQPVQNFGLAIAADRFEGYAAERTELLKFINDNNIDNTVFVTADFHGTVVNNLTYQLAPGAEQIATSAFEIITGSVAFDPAFGPTIGNFFLSPEQQAFYNSLPVANDADSIIDDKDDFIKSVINAGLEPFGYDPVGLNNNLAISDGLIHATLLQGDYIATHTYGWTEFDINPETQKLTVTTYGIETYNREELETNTEEIINRQPQIVSQFEVHPTLLVEESNLVTGTPNADILIGGVDFDAVNDNIFTGAGNDEVDVLFAGTQVGNNRIFTGSGNDLIYVSNGDKVFADSDNDVLDATDATNYRLSGGAGNDIFYLGTNGRALGGDGDDKFFVQEGGGNLISGGTGVDQFWIITGDIPMTPNTIVDFQMGTDVLGIASQGANFGFDNLTLTGDSIMIDGITIATLNGVNTSSLTDANFAFI
ncbi:phytase [Nodularia harveyana UHCC-0300]|uniref:Phytase n=1 Tax=Nodularia harveyana UHCC-0300 TaxID=2974287 RepID=A0ABU5UIZ1_9CYAN|nr:phytase [Nodularia harveyana]MEA5583318.1 phytase [Nodularia harveyana UHCC-0300]